MCVCMYLMPPMYISVYVFSDMYVYIYIYVYVYIYIYMTVVLLCWVPSNAALLGEIGSSVDGLLRFPLKRKATNPSCV